MYNKFLKKHSPIKRLGQNFLKNSFIISKIIDQMNIQYQDHMIEIGSGLGALTVPISQIVKKLIVLEIDEKLVFFLSKNIFSNIVRIFLVNALNFNYKLFLKKYDGILFRIFGNLPYNISTLFLLKIMKVNEYIFDMHFMFQKEVADRIIALPNTKKYGRLSIVTQYFYNIKIILHATQEDFFPKPKVDSTFLKFIPIFKKKNIKKYLILLGYVTQIAFKNRRKIIKNSLGILFNEKTLLSLGINPLNRPENITVLQYSKLVDLIILENLL
ncbi:16S rRNA (adenine(1518)-N(6)/adenine(1519)-N(6))-dimethyltransferase RsmA [Buchnera aphidicola]|uniref:Ribosomal RNA small subunit methyltransferase A n=1 Tax=Buchnera aphidicola subsp. Tuberolachnus salignus TaxID=98804 RepID=A0A170PBK5_BUCTT|nr:16S rRNA (adenine(1518)-N(6)/adenine(1519)-N(6))-dimethyltransferase RsmA [Buchnera aphidicola]CUR53079.1 Ribosomal RNA small subunit methyltransferase A [Buchnera aphidicola (Tuberolachnus salignus)]